MGEKGSVAHQKIGELAYWGPLEEAPYPTGKENPQRERAKKVATTWRGWREKREQEVRPSEPYERGTEGMWTPDCHVVVLQPVTRIQPLDKSSLIMSYSTIRP